MVNKWDLRQQDPEAKTRFTQKPPTPIPIFWICPGDIWVPPFNKAP